MAQFYVSPNGDDSLPPASVTPERPWATLARAATQVAPGDTVRVAHGFYNLGNDLLFPVAGRADAPIRFVAEPPSYYGQTVIRLANQFKFSPWITLENFHVFDVNPRSTGIATAYTNLSEAQVLPTITFRNCLLYSPVRTVAENCVFVGGNSTNQATGTPGGTYRNCLILGSTKTIYNANLFFTTILSPGTQIILSGCNTYNCTVVGASVPFTGAGEHVRSIFYTNAVSINLTAGTKITDSLFVGASLSNASQAELRNVKWFKTSLQGVQTSPAPGIEIIDSVPPPMPNMQAIISRLGMFNRGEALGIPLTERLEGATLAKPLDVNGMEDGPTTSLGYVVGSSGLAKDGIIPNNGQLVFDILLSEPRTVSVATSAPVSVSISNILSSTPIKSTGSSNQLKLASPGYYRVLIANTSGSPVTVQSFNV